MSSRCRPSSAAKPLCHSFRPLMPTKYTKFVWHTCKMLGALYHSLAAIWFSAIAWTNKYAVGAQSMAALRCSDTAIPAYIPDKDTAIARSCRHMPSVRGAAGGAPNGAHTECRRSESLLHFKGLWVDHLQQVVFATCQHCPCTSSARFQQQAFPWVGGGGSLGVTLRDLSWPTEAQAFSL